LAKVVGEGKEIRNKSARTRLLRGSHVTRLSNSKPVIDENSNHGEKADWAKIRNKK